ncbi:butyrophilin subfamily 1 member A1-like [Chanos chanos]|uniref:Butyrophilin subfamily 1 member A1-like n=1 Tax=Chanos chanos TaxID=29144 RepID=A0A6J2VTU5_CHACN|nr:butyrophilin subfamily 1 member A1-like [Chanos chanos]
MHQGPGSVADRVSRVDSTKVVGPDGPLVVGAGEDVILPCSLKPSISAVDMTVEWSRLHTSDSLVHLYKDDQFHVVGPDGPLVVGAGEDLILPCSLKPNISAVDMRVEWFKLHTSDSLVHLYKDGVDRNEDQIQSYRGRTSLFKEELQKGNTSLKLFIVKVSDEGEYKCLIQSENWHDDVTVQVSVEVVGTKPVISMEGYSIGKGVSLLCESNDWWPEPEVLWLDSDGNLLPAEDTETLSDPERFHVKKRVTVQDSNTNRFYCRVILRDHMKETEIVISKSIFHTWITAVICISVAVLVIIIGLIGLYFYYRRMKEHTEQIQEANPYLILSDDGKQVRCGEVRQNLPDNPERFDDSVHALLGVERFSSRRFTMRCRSVGKLTGV